MTRPQSPHQRWQCLIVTGFYLFFYFSPVDHTRENNSQNLVISNPACQMERFPESTEFISHVHLVKSPWEAFGKGEAKPEM